MLEIDLKGYVECMMCISGKRRVDSVLGKKGKFSCWISRDQVPPYL